MRLPTLIRRLVLKLVTHCARREGAAFVFTRADGVRAEVDGCACARCRNYFWITHVAIEPPAFCPYCGQRFSGAIPVSHEEMNGYQILSDREVGP
jgi:hypothetical protein